MGQLNPAAGALFGCTYTSHTVQIRICEYCGHVLPAERVSEFQMTLLLLTFVSDMHDISGLQCAMCPRHSRTLQVILYVLKRHYCIRKFEKEVVHGNKTVRYDHRLALGKTLLHPGFKVIPCRGNHFDRTF